MTNRRSVRNVIGWSHGRFQHRSTLSVALYDTCPAAASDPTEIDRTVGGAAAGALSLSQEE